MDTLREQLLHFGALVADALIRSATAFATHDMALARQVGADDNDLNMLRFSIEAFTYKMLEGQSLGEHDIRLAVSTVIVSNALEHIGDSAANVAHIALRLHSEQNDASAAFDDISTELVELAHLAADVLHDAMTAFLTANVLLAEATVRRDRELGELYERIADLSLIGAPERRLLLLRAAHSLQQTTVYAATICERAIFVATGEIKEFR